MAVILKKQQQKEKNSGKKRGGKTTKKAGFGAISNGGIKRLARRAGVKRISADSFGAVREYYERFLERLVSNALNYCEVGNRKTIQAQDVIYALKLQGRNLLGYVYESKPKTAAVDEDKKE